MVAWKQDHPHLMTDTRRRPSLARMPKPSGFARPAAARFAELQPRDLLFLVAQHGFAEHLILITVSGTEVALGVTPV
jgi:hypothetical protein